MNKNVCFQTSRQKETPTQRAFLAQNNVYKKSPQKVKHFLRTFN